MNPEAIFETAQRNRSASYGLTLVAGFPCPPEIAASAGRIQAQVDAALPGAFAWHAPNHLHVTLAAPLRSRYRPAPPLQSSELPDNLDGFLLALADFFAVEQPFCLVLRGVSLAPDGHLVCQVDGADPVVQGFRRRLASCLATFPALDPLRTGNFLHLTLGYLTIAPGEAEDASGADILPRLGLSQARLAEVSMGIWPVAAAWLVHYANRTLDAVVGRLRLPLGERIPPEIILAGRPVVFP
jgi:hypothetical protein